MNSIHVPLVLNYKPTFVPSLSEGTEQESPEVVEPMPACLEVIVARLGHFVPQ